MNSKPTFFNLSLSKSWIVKNKIKTIIQHVPFLFSLGMTPSGTKRFAYCFTMKTVDSPSSVSLFWNGIYCMGRHPFGPSPSPPCDCRVRRTNANLIVLILAVLKSTVSKPRVSWFCQHPWNSKNSFLGCK